MSLTTLRGAVQAVGNIGGLLAVLQGTNLDTEVAKDRLGFRAYDRMAKIRAFAIRSPGIYLDLKRIKISGGDIPAVGFLPLDYLPLFFGTYANGAIYPGIAGNVSELYAKTVEQLYAAGAPAEVAEEYARKVATASMNAQLAIVEQELPDIIDSLSEKTLLLNQLGSVGGRVLLRGEGRVKAIAHK